MKILMVINAILFIFLAFVACVKSTEVDTKECHRCTYGQIFEELCSTALIHEICIVSPHEASLQMILEKTEICNGMSIVTEDIGFLEDVLAEHISAGAVCERI